MPDRFWVGGAGNWSSTAKWSATSGGASGASVPTTADVAIFDANSGGKFTATVDTNQSVGSITITPSAAVGVLQIALSARLTTNNLTTTSTAGNNRVWFRGNTLGIAEDLVVNGTVSISDCDFRDIYVTGTSAPISGTRIGNLSGCRGITFSTPKTVYWVGPSSANWSSNSWAATSGGAAATSNFPLGQDTAVINNVQPSAGQTITIDAALPNTGTVDASARTNFININPGTCFVHGDWKNGTGASLSGSTTITFSGRKTQTITSAGVVFLGNITIDSYDGTVQLADALSLATNATPITVTNGTFDTAGYSITAGSLVSSNSNVRSIFLRASTVTLTAASPLSITSLTNLTFNAGTSTINLSSGSGISVNAPGVTYNNVAFTDTAGSATISVFGGGYVFNNLTVAAPAFSTIKSIAFDSFSAVSTINGTLTISGATPTRRLFLCTPNLNSPVTLSVNALSATDCDFRDVIITGAAAGSSPTRAGNCGGNTGINFPAPKTVYWNLSGTQNWSSTGWASASGGTPAINNFPLAQDTAVFDNAGAAGTVTIDAAWALGTVAMGSRTTAMTLTTSVNVVYGDWTFGTGVTSGGTQTLTFGGRSTQTITSNGVTFNTPVFLNSVNATIQLADALTLASTHTLTLNRGTFNAVTYNVTAGLFSGGGTALLMGSGTWTLSGTGNVWSISGLGFLDPQTADITLSNTSTTARNFSGAGYAYNKLTIGGATGTSTLNILGDNTFTELASTKTVAHTIAFSTSAQAFGKWSVTGTVGNVVTLTGTGTGHIMAGPATSGIDYLAMGSVVFASGSPGEFYAGANSTGTATAPVFRTAPPAPRTLYWVGGTGNWSDTARWSTSSGGAGGAAVPTSLDAVIFNAASNATAYTATIDVDSRCSTLTIAGPASGNVTLAGTAALAAQNTLTLPATGMSRTYNGLIRLSGTGSGKVFTTNGVVLSSSITVYGVGASWELGSALNIGSGTLSVTAGSFSLSTYNLTATALNSSFLPPRTINFGSGTTTLSGTSGTINFGTTAGIARLLTVIPGTSQINLSSVNPDFRGNSKTFNNVTYTGISFATSLAGGNTFNNLTFNARTSTGVTTITFGGTTTVTGTLSKPAGADATRRHVFGISAGGATLACNAVSFTDVDFINITLTGAAAPASGTRLGDRKGNTGITFDAPKTVYWNLAGSQSWSAVGWATTIGGTPAANNLPLAQDTAVFTSTSPASGSTITFDQNYAVGTIDMSARTTSTLTLAVTNNLFITGNWINGTGTTLSGSGTTTFGGRTSQTITSAGRPFTQNFTIDSPGGSVTLQDALVLSAPSNFVLQYINGTFNANNYNVTLSDATSGSVTTTGDGVRTLAVGSGTWTLAATGSPWNVGNRTNLTVTGTGTITLTSASAKTFNGGGVSYTDITLNQGGAGVLTILSNNAFKDITNTFKSTGATSIDFGNTTQRVAQWTAAGEAGRLLTILGTSEASPATLILTGVVDPAADYLIVRNIRAYAITDTWYAGNNSQNEGSLGWIFGTGATIYAVFVSETSTAADAVAATAVYPVSLVDSAQALDQLAALFVAQTAVSETAQALDTASTSAALAGTVSETAQARDTVSTTASVIGAVSETSIVSDVAASDASASRAVAESATAQDTQLVAASTFIGSTAETARAADSDSALAVLGAAVADTAAALDVTASASFVNRSVTDTATGADTAAGALIVTVAYADSAAVQDVQAVAASAFSGIAAETARAADTTQLSASVGVSASDPLRLTDTASSVAVNRVSVAESATVADADAANVVFRTAFTDSSTAQDQTAAAGAFVLFAVDSARMTDEVFSQPVLLAAVQDTAQAVDEAQSAYTAVAFVDEVVLAEVQVAVAASIFSAEVSEQGLGQALFVAGGGFFASLAEFAAISDQSLSKFLWNPIPDDQVPDWQLINDTQAANWQIIDDEQPAVWTPIST